jgi:hypothetical protein
MRVVVAAVVLLSSTVAQAQTIPLTCQGEFKIYRPSRTDADVPPGSGSVDLARKRFTSPVGNFNISTVTESAAEIRDSFVDKGGRRLIVRGNFDRTSGKVWIMWLTEQAAHRFDTNQNAGAEMYASMLCGRANRVF